MTHQPISSDDLEIDDDHALRLFHSLDETPTAENDFDMGFGQPQWLLDAHNTMSGRVFILGTGPSLLKQLPLLGALKNEETWTVNRMQRFKELPFTPTHHSIAEPGPVTDWGRGIDYPYDYPTAKNRLAIHWTPVTAPGWLWVAKAHDDVQVRWQGFFGLGDYLPPIPSAWASPLTAAQVACWLGFTELYLLGCDTTQTGQAWDTVGGRTKFKRSILAILECADRAKHEIFAAGRSIYDCAPGGKLNEEGVLDYVELGDVLGTDKAKPAAGEAHRAVPQPVPSD